MTYPGLPKHIIHELEWIKERYDELLKRQTGSRIEPAVKAKDKHEMLQIDAERTDIFLSKINSKL